MYHTPAGIDYTIPAFLDSAGNSRIAFLWDQAINPCEAGSTGENQEGCNNLKYGRIPEGFTYGVEYNNEEINEAINSISPWEIVPSRDTNGHGTFIAGVACGSLIEENNFAGVAPLTTICVVKCKEAKSTLKSFYQISTNEPVYSEADILVAVDYLLDKAARIDIPLIICIGLGTNQGGHTNGGILGNVLAEIGNFNGVGVVTSCGNEANSGRHYRSEMIEAGGDTEVEIRSGGTSGFTLELWNYAPQVMSVGIISPSGEYSGKTFARYGERRKVNFILENTVVYIEYRLLAYESGDECIQMRFQSPSEGIWKIRVFNETRGSAFFDMWLPISNFLSDTTYFLKPDPDVTLCEPSNNQNLVSVSYYDSANGSIAINSSRGFTRDGKVKPDFAAPGIGIYGPLPRIGNIYPATEEERKNTARYDYKSGSSMAAAITSGIAAMLMEWGVLRGNDITMDTVSIQKYLIRGSNGTEEPNRLWGDYVIIVPYIMMPVGKRYFAHWLMLQRQYINLSL